MSIATEYHIPTETDIVGHVEVLAPQLEAAARYAYEAARDDRTQRISCSELVEAAIRLRIALWTYARRLVGLERRTLHGFAIGLDDEAGNRWYLHHSLHWGNLMRTNRVESAAIWPDVESLRGWAAIAGASRGEDHKGKAWPPPLDQLDPFDVYIFPVAVQVGEGTLLRRKIRSL